jgi:hypothetical protein
MVSDADSEQTVVRLEDKLYQMVEEDVSMLDLLNQ